MRSVAPRKDGLMINKSIELRRLRPAKDIASKVLQAGQGW